MSRMCDGYGVEGGNLEAKSVKAASVGHGVPALARLSGVNGEKDENAIKLGGWENGQLMVVVLMEPAAVVNKFAGPRGKVRL